MSASSVESKRMQMLCYVSNSSVRYAFLNLKGVHAGCQLPAHSTTLQQIYLVRGATQDRNVGCVPEFGHRRVERRVSPQLLQWGHAIIVGGPVGLVPVASSAVINFGAVWPVRPSARLLLGPCSWAPGIGPPLLGPR